MLEVMERYGWDYHTYDRQPSWVLDLAVKKMSMEAKLEASRQTTQPETHA